MKYSIADRVAKGNSLHREGYNCAQSVAMAFDDVIGLSAEQISWLTAPFGAGFGGNGELCGAVAGMGIVLGAVERPKPSGKKLVYDKTLELTDEFKSHNGSIVCSRLKGQGRVPCSTLIADAIAIVASRLQI